MALHSIPILVQSLEKPFLYLSLPLVSLLNNSEFILKLIAQRVYLSVLALSLLLIPFSIYGFWSQIKVKKEIQDKIQMELTFAELAGTSIPINDSEEAKAAAKAEEERFKESSEYHQLQVDKVCYKSIIENGFSDKYDCHTSTLDRMYRDGISDWQHDASKIVLLTILLFTPTLIYGLKKWLVWLVTGKKPDLSL